MAISKNWTMMKKEAKWVNPWSNVLWYKTQIDQFNKATPFTEYFCWIHNYVFEVRIDDGKKRRSEWTISLMYSDVKRRLISSNKQLRYGVSCWVDSYVFEERQNDGEESKVSEVLVSCILIWNTDWSVQTKNSVTEFADSTVPFLRCRRKRFVRELFHPCILIWNADWSVRKKQLRYGVILLSWELRFWRSGQWWIRKRRE